MKSRRVLGCMMLVAAIALGVSTVSNSQNLLSQEAASLVGGEVGGADCGVLLYISCDGKDSGDSTSVCPQDVLGLLVNPLGNVKVKNYQSCGSHADCMKNPRTINKCIKGGVDPEGF